jgi:acyl dehydratase
VVTLHYRVSALSHKPDGLPYNAGLGLQAAGVAVGPRSTSVAGLYFEELTVGKVFKHAIRRTVTEADNVFFSALTHNPAALHLDEEYCREHTEFGQRIVNSAFTLGLMVGISVGDTTLGTTVANLGWDEVRFPRPLFHGDTVRVESEVIETRESKSRPQNGIVVFAHRAYNQRDELVGSCKRSALMLRRPAT